MSQWGYCILRLPWDNESYLLAIYLLRRLLPLLSLSPQPVSLHPSQPPGHQKNKKHQQQKKNNTNKSIMWRKKKYWPPHLSYFFCRLSSARQPRGAALLFGRLTQRLCGWHRSDGRAQQFESDAEWGPFVSGTNEKNAHIPQQRGIIHPPTILAFPTPPERFGTSVLWQRRQPSLLFGWLRPLSY